MLYPHQFRWSHLNGDIHILEAAGISEMSNITEGHVHEGLGPIEIAASVYAIITVLIACTIGFEMLKDAIVESSTKYTRCVFCRYYFISFAYFF